MADTISERAKRNYESAAGPDAPAWAAVTDDMRDLYRESARQELAEEAKRGGDHEAMKAFHDLGNRVTGGGRLAAPNTGGAQLELGKLADEFQRLVNSFQDLANAVKALVAVSREIADQNEEDLQGSQIARLADAADRAELAL